MSALHRKTLLSLIALYIFMTLTLFAAAGTWRYWQAWLFLVVFDIATLAMTLYLIKFDPQLLERRSAGGPAAEQSVTQKVIMSFASLGFLALLVVPALDHRYGWSGAPPQVTLCAEAVFIGSYASIMWVFRANSFASSTIAVEPGQRVISTGPYAYVRHPMYTAGLVLLATLPPSLGSWWGLVIMIPLAAIIVWRLLDEESFLTLHLPGYAAYRSAVKFRLIPFLF